MARTFEDTVTFIDSLDLDCWNYNGVAKTREISVPNGRCKTIFEFWTTCGAKSDNGTGTRAFLVYLGSGSGQQKLDESNNFWITHRSELGKMGRKQWNLIRSHWEWFRSKLMPAGVDRDSNFRIDLHS